jgi:hypothetical protein
MAKIPDTVFDRHEDFQVIDPVTNDRMQLLIAELMFTAPSVIQRLLTGKVDRTMLSPELLLAFSTDVNTDIINVVADGAGQAFPLTAEPLFGSELIFLNGQDQLSGADYVITGTTITFPRYLTTGDVIKARYIDLLATSTQILGSFDMPYQNIFEVDSFNNFLYMYGDDKIGPNDKKFVKIDPITLTQSGSAINVESGLPDNSAVIQLGAKFWVIGSPSTAINNRVIQVDPATMNIDTDLEIVPSTDTTAVIAALATDGLTFFYAYIKGGTVAPHQIAKLDPNGVPVIPGTIQTNLSPSTVGAIDMAVSSSGHLFVVFSSINGGDGEIRKYDPGDGSLLETYNLETTVPTNPTRIIPVEDKMYVIDPATNKLWEIPNTGDPSSIVTFAATPTNLAFDNNDLWISFGEDLVKMARNGTTLTSFIPVVAGQTIQDVSYNIGHVWTTYLNDTGVKNVTKIFPGLPGV